MDEPRRRFFSVGAAAAAALAIPAGAVAVEVTDKAVGPIMYEHVCDGGRSRYSPEDLKWAEEHGRTQWGCGTRFRW